MHVCAHVTAFRCHIPQAQKHTASHTVSPQASMAASTSSGDIPRALKGPPTVSSASGTPFTYSSRSQRSNGGRKGSQCMTSKPANCGQEGIQQLGAQLATQSTDTVAGAQALMSQAMHALAREHTEIPNNIPFLLWAKISNTATPEQERHMTQMLAQFSRGAKVPTLMGHLTQVLAQFSRGAKVLALCHTGRIQPHCPSRLFLLWPDLPELLR